MEIDESLSSPGIVVSEDLKTLRVPSEAVLNEASLQDILRSWLVGHELHPYTEASGRVLFKPAQLEALSAYEEAVESGARSFLHVAPTAVGKTLVLTKALLKRSRNQVVSATLLKVF